MNELYTPKDNDFERDRWEARQLGTCGPSVVAVLLNKTVSAVIRSWPVEYKGHANMRDVISMLKQEGVDVRRAPGGKSKTLELPAGAELAIARIQWEGEWQKHWMEAQRHTHFIVMRKINGVVYVFCNGRGWFAPSVPEDPYLDAGHITSFAVVSTVDK